MHKRPLVICAIMFIVGGLISFYRLPPQIIIGILLIAVAYLRRKGKAQLILVALIIILLGVWRVEVAYNHSAKIKSRYADTTASVTLVIAEPSDSSGAAAFMETEYGRIGVYLRADEKIRFNCGDIVTADVTFRALTRRNPVKNAFRRHLDSLGIYILAETDSVTVQGVYNKGFIGKLYSLRRWAHTLAEDAFFGDRLALFCAMVLGDKTLLSDELYAALRGSGLNHIAVVSGMHLTVAIAFIAIIARKIFGKGRRISVIAISGAVFIALFTGAGVSVVRALIMCFVYYMGRILYRDQDGITTLFFAVWVLSIINPYIIFNVGLILSFLSVLGIILYAENFSIFLRKLIPEKVAGAVSLTISAQLALMPALIWYFDSVTPYAPLSNIVAVPLSAIFVVLGMIFILISPIKPLVAILTPIINFFADGIVSLCENISSLPFAMYRYGGEFVPFTVCWTLLAIVIFYRQKISNNNFLLKR